MKTINLRKQINGTSTNIEGATLKLLLEPYINNNEKVQVSFKDTTPMSSSFFNSSFGELIDSYGYEKFRCIVFPIDISTAHMSLIRKYISLHLENMSV